jgi:hypothetical protein
MTLVMCASKDINECFDEWLAVAEDEARVAAAVAQAEANADVAWRHAALGDIEWGLAIGCIFLAQNVTLQLAERGLETHDKRAMGAVIREARKRGLIKSVGIAIDSYGSPKTQWQRIAQEVPQ